MPDKWAEVRKEWKVANRDKVNGYARKRRATETLEQREQRRKYQREYMAKNGHKYKSTVRERRFKYEYNITESDYNQMFEDQHGLCAICMNPETRRSRSGEISPLSVDHDHKTGAVRALLCHNCNSALGQLKEDPNSMLNMFTYINIFNAGVSCQA